MTRRFSTRGQLHPAVRTRSRAVCRPRKQFRENFSRTEARPPDYDQSVSKVATEFQVGSSGAAGLDGSPLSHPRHGLLGATPRGLSGASAWWIGDVVRARSAYGRGSGRDLSIIRWQSIGMSSLLSKASTTGNRWQGGHEWCHSRDGQTVGAVHCGELLYTSSAKSGGQGSRAISGPAIGRNLL